jgi:probable rRNA maturation factor
LQKLNYDNEEISVLFCSDEFIKELNSQYRNIDSATDVLSFENGEEYEDEEGLWKNVGDIAISLETLPKNAEYFEVDTNTELKRLIIHGILHLNGMDHGEEHIEKGVVPTDEMLVLQENLLSDLIEEKIIG